MRNLGECQSAEDGDDRVVFKSPSPENRSVKIRLTFHHCAEDKFFEPQADRIVEKGDFRNIILDGI